MIAICRPATAYSCLYKQHNRGEISKRSRSLSPVDAPGDPQKFELDSYDGYRGRVETRAAWQRRHRASARGRRRISGRVERCAAGIEVHAFG